MYWLPDAHLDLNFRDLAPPWRRARDNLVPLEVTVRGMEAAEPILEIKIAAVFGFWRSRLKKNNFYRRGPLKVIEIIRGSSLRVAGYFCLDAIL